MFHKCTYRKNSVLSYIFSLLKHCWIFNKPILIWFWSLLQSKGYIYLNLSFISKMRVLSTPPDPFQPMLWLFCVARAILGDWFNSSRYVEDLLSGRYTLMEFLVAVNFLLHFLIVYSQAACGRCQNFFSAYLQCKQTVFLLFESDLNNFILMLHCTIG